MGDEAGHVEQLPGKWWNGRLALSLIVLATAIPLLWPQIPPLVDLPGHIGRYRVELDLAHSPFLQRYYDYHWAPIGSLGVDALVICVAPLIGLEPAVKLIVAAIPLVTATGMLWVAREVHERVPPTAFFALPFIYGFPLQFGFVNFALSAGLAFLALGSWLWLARRGRTRLRGLLFVPISFVLFFCHTYGWGMLGLMCFAAEAVRRRNRELSWPSALLAAALSCLVMVGPLLVMVAIPAHGQGPFGSGWFDWDAKWVGLMGILRDRWGPFDVAAVEAAAVIILFALLSPKLGWSRRLGGAALLFAIAFVLLPRFLFDSAYADVRLLPFAFAMALLAIRVRPENGRGLPNLLAVLGLGFFALRLAGTTISLAMAGEVQEAKLAALNGLPRGVRVASFYVLPYAEPWALQRDSHLGGMVIARRNGFSNDQWITAGHNLLELRYAPKGFASNPSQIIRPNGTHDGVYRTVDQALSALPRDRFDYVWMLNPIESDPRLLQGLKPVWSGSGSVLYRIGLGAPANE